MANNGIPSGRVISADEAAFRSMASTIAGLCPGETLLDFAARGPDVIRETSLRYARPSNGPMHSMSSS